MLSMWRGWFPHWAVLPEQASMPPLRQTTRNDLLPYAPGRSAWTSGETRWIPPDGYRWRHRWGCRPDDMRMPQLLDQDRGARSHHPPSFSGLWVMQLNFRKSETTWVLCGQELLDRQCSNNIILVQDPPSSVGQGKVYFRATSSSDRPLWGVAIL